MGRLVAFGCSLTYGHGLPDCHVPPDQPGPFPSNYAWPSIVAAKLKIGVVNKGKPAASNEFILSEVLAFPVEHSDIVVIFWSFYDRAMLYCTNSRLGVIPNSEDSFRRQLSEEYYRLHGDYDLFMQTALSISHANLFLEKKQVPVYNFYFDTGLNERFTQYPDTPANSHKLNFLISEEMRIDVALDNRHPGVKSQELIAKNMLNIIKEKHD